MIERMHKKGIKILIVEDDREIKKNLQSLLTQEGYHVQTAATRAEAVKWMEKENFSLLLLDLMLPDGSGYSLCTAIRQTWDIPIIIVTAMEDEASVVTGFDLGADDYVIKPFRPMELLSRIKNVLRRKEKNYDDYKVGDIHINPMRAMVTKKGKEVPLSPLEYRLLLILFHHQGEVVSRGRLLEEIWDLAGDFVNDNTLTVYIKRLREKIEEDPANPQLIKTLRGMGYRLEE